MRHFVAMSPQLPWITTSVTLVSLLSLLLALFQVSPGFLVSLFWCVRAFLVVLVFRFLLFCSKWNLQNPGTSFQWFGFLKIDPRIWLLCLLTRWERLGNKVFKSSSRSPITALKLSKYCLMALGSHLHLWESTLPFVWVRPLCSCREDGRSQGTCSWCYWWWWW